MNKKRLWERHGVTREDSLRNIFISNGYGNSAKTVASNVNKSAEHGITAQEIHPYVQKQIQTVRDAKDIFAMLPDLRYAASLGTASILSTDDLLTISLIYTSGSKKLSLEMKSRLSGVLQGFFKDELKFNQKLYDIVYKMRYVNGSYPIVILPEASVSDLINGDYAGVGTERWSDNNSLNIYNVGLIGSPDDISVSAVGAERYFRKRKLAASKGYDTTLPIRQPLTNKTSLEFDIPLTLTDNIQVLRLPTIKRMHDADIASSMLGREAYGVSRNAEYYVQEECEKPDVELFASKTFKYQHLATLKATNMASRPSVDRPTLMDIPPEACCVVHSPGTFTAPIGVLIALDELGHPLAENNHYTTVISNYLRRNVTSDNIDAVAKGVGVAKDRVYEWTERRLAELTKNLVMTKFVNSLKNGNYGHSNITLADNPSFVRTMIATGLSQKRTQLLFVPIENITYFATSFNSDGTGLSIIEETKILASMRVGSKFAALHAAVNNARSITNIKITLDADDRDPESHIERVKSDAANMINQPLPLTGSSDDWNKHLANNGMVFSIQGNEHYPTTETEVSTDTNRYEYPDGEQEERNAKDMYTAFGVNPAVILDGSPVETATQVTVKDLHAARVAMVEQEKLAPLITHFVKNYTYADPLLLDALAKEIEEVLIERNNAKRINRIRALEKEAVDASKAEAKNTAADAPATGATPEAAPKAAPETTPEETKGSAEAELNAQSDSEFAFESEHYWARPGKETFVDFYNKVDNMTTDNFELVATPNTIKAIISEYLATLNVSLPGPENAKINSAMEQLTTRKEQYTAIAEIVFPDGLFPEDSTLSGKEATLRSNWVAYELTNYIRNNGLCDSIVKLIDAKGDPETLHELIDDITDRGIAAMVIAKTINDRLGKQAEALELSGESTGSDDSTDAETDTDTNTDDGSDGGQDDGEFNFEDDLTGNTDADATENEAEVDPGQNDEEFQQ